jgi:hypothetical protein
LVLDGHDSVAGRERVEGVDRGEYPIANPETVVADLLGRLCHGNSAFRVGEGAVLGYGEP